jgi:hypothetical protein
MYTEEALLEAFEKGFSLGFEKGKTRNIITEKYYEARKDEALVGYKKLLPQK